MEGEKPNFSVFSSSFIRPSWSSLLLFFILLTILSVQITTRATFPVWIATGLTTVRGSSERPVESDRPRSCSGFFKNIEVEAGKEMAPAVMSIKDFGGVGDGETSNTEIFRKAIQHLQRFGDRGGSKLIIPKGRWVTGSFNLTSNFTLFLEEGAVILGSQDPDEWPIIEPLPSYGRGRERLGGRHISLIHGNGLSNVVITGENGTIDGRGEMWWELWWNRTLNHTRGHLLELMYSQNILISNLTFRNSPFWTIHPVYCSNVVIRSMTIMAPLTAPNTDGIDPDSSTNVCIEDCYIESGDDLVAVKSGWDQYGISMARPSSNVIIRRVSGTTPTCSGVGIGSEMSGGISNITIEDLHVWDSAAGIRIKSDQGRGGYITNISISNLLMDRVKMTIRFSRGSNDHPDDGWDPKAVPKVNGIFVRNIVSLNSKKAPVLDGIEGASFEEICFRNITILGLAPSAEWQCKYISGFSSDVFPVPCPQLQNSTNSLSSLCSSP